MAKPDFNLCATKEGQNGFSQIGAAWQNDKGQISIRLNTCVTITDRDDIKLYLFPVTDQRKPQIVRNKPILRDEFDYGPPPIDDDIPF